MENTELKNAFGRLKEGNTEAFEEIYNSLKKPVYTVILRYLGVKEDAEDVTQEVFLKLFRAPPGEEVKNIRAYIFASARNAAMDKLRERASEGEREELTDTLPYGEDDAAERMDVTAAISRLSDSEREAVSLHIYAELTFREMAEVTGVPMGTLLWRYNRAISKLRVYLS